MKDYQARGYIFESVIWKMLTRFGYIGVNTAQLRGRGAAHQIDAFGTLKIPTPFIYPIRLLCEVKCYSGIIQLEKIRNFVGVLKDISENYIVGENGERNTPERYTDVGAYFSTSSYTLSAQNYAWAHNIFLVSFNNIPVLRPVIALIKNFVNNYSKEDLETKTKKEVIEEFWDIFKPQFESENDIGVQSTNLVIGILDGIYPVGLIGNNRWMEKLEETTVTEELIVAEKTSRRSNKLDTLFSIDVNGSEVYFSVPNMIADRIIRKVENGDRGNLIFNIDIPFIQTKDQKKKRRFINLEVLLPDKKLYISHLSQLNEQDHAG